MDLCPHPFINITSGLCTSAGLLGRQWAWPVKVNTVVQKLQVLYTYFTKLSTRRGLVVCLLYCINCVIMADGEGFIMVAV